MKYLRRLSLSFAMMLAFGFVLSVGLTSCGNKKTNEKEKSEHPQGEEHSDSEHPEGAEHPNDSTE